MYDRNNVTSEIQMTFPYGLEKHYKITNNTEAAEFLCSIVQKHFNYTPTSKREKFWDIKINENLGLNVKTRNLMSKQTKGRICSVQISHWLRNYENNLKLLYIDYKNENGNLTLESVNEVFIEEVNYHIENQGKGLLQPHIKKNGDVDLRGKLSRLEWLIEFEDQYRKYIEKRTLKNKEYLNEFCILDNNTLERFM